MFKPFEAFVTVMSTNSYIEPPTNSTTFGAPGREDNYSDDDPDADGYGDGDDDDDDEEEEEEEEEDEDEDE